MDFEWLLTSDEPWTRYRTLVDLMGRAEDDPEAQVARREMLAHPAIRALLARAAAWTETPITRHNDAKHPVYAWTTLVDFGVRYDDDPDLAHLVDVVLGRQAPEGAFQTVVNVPKAFGGSGEDLWTWMACDAPTLLYALAGSGLARDARVERAVGQLAGLADENGWRCRAAASLGRFKGPGRRDDPCPIANVYALKALAAAAGAGQPELLEGAAARAGVEMLLDHWAHRGQIKYYMFGVGTDYRKVKYPFIWYDLLHVTDVLSRFPVALRDVRFQEMVAALVAQADSEGRYTAGSMYMAWKGWSFADKKAPSPWLTMLVQRVARRSTCGGPGIPVA